MNYETLLYENNDGVLTLTLNRPANLNAFTVRMAEDLINAYRDASEDDSVRAIVVTGSGKAFCAGMDLGTQGNVFGLDESLHPTRADLEQRLEDPEIVHGVRDTGGRVSLAVYQCKKPVIASINGAAVGIGATMTLPMDFRFASDKLRMGFVFGKLGIVPEACSSWFLPRIVGITKALELTYSARIIDADEALRCGLVSEVHPVESVLAKAQAFARSLVTDRSPVSVALIRQMMWRNSAAPDPVQAHRVDSLAMYYTSIGDGKEGVASFLEKRVPNFQQKASAMPDFYPWWND
ncbi:MAG: crotonase/enoyl-CoA hydratase family protein [Burkholderiales bacterium]